ncbi:MAG: glycosyltransferase family 4 protein [Pseudomonadota bacterium]
MADAAPPRILFVSHNFPPKMGGIELVVLRVWESLTTSTHAEALVQAGLAERPMPNVRRAKLKGLAGLGLALMGHLPVLWWQRIRGRTLDAVVSGSAVTALPTLWLARVAGAKAIVITHGLDTVYDRGLYQALYRFAMPRVDRVIAVSEATRTEATHRGVMQERTAVLSPGCDAERFAQAHDTKQLRERWALGGGPVLLSAGRLVHRKGLAPFIRDCLPLIVDAIPNVRLLIAGGNPEGALVHTRDVMTDVQEAISESGLTEHVIITGRLSDQDMLGAFGVADVFILPAVPTPGDMEGFGIVLLEAGAAGLPVVATKLGGICDAVDDSRSGYLVEPGNYRHMADALIALMQAPATRQKIGDFARERVLHHFTWEKATKRFTDAIIST